jgi:hypothetical protein
MNQSSLVDKSDQSERKVDCPEVSHESISSFTIVNMANKFAKAYKSPPSTGGYRKLPLLAVFIILFLLFFIYRDQITSSSFESFHMLGIKSKSKYLRAVTWNIAAINNNPFEYWITNSDPSYNRIMSSISGFIENPGANDVTVKEIFTEKMFLDLEESMISAGWEGVPETRLGLGLGLDLGFRLELCLG